MKTEAVENTKDSSAIFDTLLLLEPRVWSRNLNIEVNGAKIQI